MVLKNKLQVRGKSLGEDREMRNRVDKGNGDERKGKKGVWRRKGRGEESGKRRGEMRKRRGEKLKTG